MKKDFTLPALFLLCVLVWFSAIFWVPVIADFLDRKPAMCTEAPESEECKSRVARFGATGDLFGAVNALFSSLALFSVAWTIWSEGRARREGRKPLLIYDLGQDSVMFDGPEFNDPKALILKIEGELKNLGEAALNASVDLHLVAKGRIIPLGRKLLDIPVAGGTTSGKELAYKIRLQSEDLKAVVSALTSNGTHETELHVYTKCVSLEVVPWETKAIYVLEFYGGDKLTALMTKGEAEGMQLWAGGGAQGLNVCIREGSWSHVRSASH